MTTPETNQVTEDKQSEKEFNFRQLEAKYQRQLEQERSARMEAEKKVQEAVASRQQPIDSQEEDDNEPYVDHKRLNRTLSSFEKKMEDKIEKRAKEISKQEQLEERRSTWLKNNPDFYQILQHAEKFAERDPELAETILEMPEGFERQKLVYKNIKALGIHLPEVKQNTIQDKINGNKQNPYYQPSGIANSPYQNAGDFSAAGKKQAYDKMKEMQSRLRLG
jgi:hypothetical protein